MYFPEDHAAAGCLHHALEPDIRGDVRKSTACCLREASDLRSHAQHANRLERFIASGAAGSIDSIMRPRLADNTRTFTCWPDFKAS